MRWIIGDVHGMLRPLMALVEHVGRVDASPQYLFVGDYVNRGPDTRGVIDLVLALPGARFVRGNHDDVLDLILSGSCYADNDAAGKPAVAVRWFLDHGLSETLASYGLTPEDVAGIKRHPAEGVKRIRAAIPESHQKFLHGLGPTIEEDAFFVAHAYWPPNDPTPMLPLAVRLADSPRFRRDVTWARFGEKAIDQPKTWPRVGYFGHTPTYKYEKKLPAPFAPITGDKLLLLDTAAANDLRGRLTAYCHEEERFVQADREGMMVE